MGTVSATVEIIMRVVARTHRLIQLNDSFAGPKHHLRVCPGSIYISASMGYVRLCVRARVSSSRRIVSRKRTSGPTPRRVVASRNNTMLLMLRLQFRHNFLSWSLESGAGKPCGYRLPGLSQRYGEKCHFRRPSDNEERRISFTAPRRD